MKSMLTSAVQSAVELLFPGRCVHCGKSGSLLCDVCLDQAVRLDGPVCDRCALPMPQGSRCQKCAASPPALDRMLAVFQMDGPIRDAVHALKYNDLRALAPVLAAEMAALPAVQRMKVDVVVPTPMHPSRVRARGYNQSDLLASRLAKALDWPVDDHALRRVVNTPPQVKAQDESSRIRAMAGAFRSGDGFGDRRVLLVDDVATTGSTLNACASTLRQAGAAWVGALVLAREI
ncbi:MAG: ComF family protein [Dehalococcoidia bacterium]